MSLQSVLRSRTRAPRAGEPPIPAPPFADPLREVRALKRWVQIGVYAAILGTEPFYLFVLHYSWPQLLSGLFVGLVIAIVAIEGAFGQMFKLRKRSAYPGVLLQQLSTAPDVESAVTRALPVIDALLRTKGSFVMLEDGDKLRMVVGHGMIREDADALIKSCNVDMKASMEGPSPSACTTAEGDLRGVLVPAVAFAKPLALFGLCARRGSDLRDNELLEAIGLALGLSLHNLRQKEELVEREMRFRALIENSSDGIALVGPDATIVYASPSTERILGYSADEVVGMKTFDLIHPDDQQAAAQTMAALLTQPGSTQNTFRRFRRKDGVWRWLESSVTNLLREPSVRALVVNYRDVTERRLADEALRASEERFRSIQESALDAIITMSPEGVITSWNPQAEITFGWAAKEVVGRTLADTIIPAQHREAHTRGVHRFLQTGEGEVLNKRIEIAALDRHGREFPIELAVVPLYRDDAVSFCAFIRDIRERKKAEETIRHLAYHDVLTGLPNRVLFEERLRMELAQAKRGRQKVAVMCLDLDRFKIVNDTVGHTGGDQLLQEVAREFAEAIREGDTVSRVGGDEFTFLLPGIEHVEDAAVVAERVLHVIRHPRTIGGQEFRVTTSIGITIFPRDGEDVESLLRNADTAMYRAKERGRDNFQVYTPAMKATLLETLALENDLSHALEREELVVHYQPVMEIQSGRIVGAEALLRWQHPGRGLVGPDEFIPLAEETGLIVPIGEWVLHTACLQAGAWNDSGLGPLRITVNVSARQVEHPGLVPLVARVLEETRLPPQFLHLELTEGAVMRHVESVISTLSELRALGIGISVDDFGTGYSSLGYLKRFPIDTIKIDRSFVGDVTTDHNDAAIVSTVIAMARSLKLRVIAEGVETQPQLDFLRQAECDEFQGFLLSRAVPAEAFERLVRRQPRLQARVLPLKFG
jgi:diguanylate cyclase (GGDEF)-like protein/PAS domain S-box-containing protein